MNPMQPIDLKQLISFVSMLPESSSICRISDSSNSLIYANNAYYSLIGRDSAESEKFEEESISKTIHPEDLSVLKTFLKHTKAGNEIFEENIRLLKKENTYIWVHIKIQIFQQTNEKEKIAFVCYTPLIRKADSPLITRFDINRLSKFIEKLPAGLSIIYVSHDFTSLEEIDAFYAYINNGFLHIHFQDEVNDIYTNKSIFNNLNPEDVKALYPKFLEAKKNSFQALFEADYRSLCGDEKYHWLHSIMRYISTTDNYDIFYLTVMNVDDFVAEKELFKKKYMEEKKKLNTWSKDKFFFCSFNITNNSIQEFNTYNEMEISSEHLKNIDTAVSFLKKHIYTEEDYVSVSNFLLKENFMSHYAHGELQFSIQYQHRFHNIPIWVELSVLLLNPQSDNLLGFAILTNINEKKRSENLFKRLISIDYDNVIIIKIQNESCKTIFARNATIPLSIMEKDGYTNGCNAYLRAHCSEDEFSDLSKKFSLSTVKEKLSEENIYILTFSYKNKTDIQYKKVYFTYTDSTCQYICLVLQDVTSVFQKQEKNKKLLQDAVIQSEKANFIKKEFLSHISHDIRTPLNAIMGFTNLAKDIKEVPEEVLYFLNKIDSSRQLLTGLFNDVIDMAQLEQGHIELHPEVYNFEDFYSSIIAPVEIQCKEKHIKLFYDKNISFPSIIVDRQRFNQIFYNLFSNATKYSFTGDKISFTIENSRVESNLFVADYIVEDSGTGISSSLQKQLTNLFENKTGSDFNINSGFGLGLLIVKSFVSLLGGTIKFSTLSGKGTKFTISMALPLAHPSAKRNVYVEDFSMLAGKTILLVEDSDLNREILYRQLEKKNMRVIQAINGEDAINIFSAADPGTFNAILMDIHMPIINGYEATKLIRTLNRVDALLTPIIGMSANGFVEDIKNSLSAGMVAHLTKPIDLNRLYGTLAAFCTT